MNKKSQLLVVGMAPLKDAEKACLMMGELAELRDKGYVLEQLAKHALQFTDVFDVAVSHDGFSVYPHNNSNAFLLVTTRPIGCPEGGPL